MYVEVEFSFISAVRYSILLHTILHSKLNLIKIAECVCFLSIYARWWFAHLNITQTHISLSSTLARNCSCVRKTPVIPVGKSREIAQLHHMGSIILPSHRPLMTVSNIHHFFLFTSTPRQYSHAIITMPSACFHIIRWNITDWRHPATVRIAIDIGDGEAASNDISPYLILGERCITGILLAMVTSDKLFARLPYFAPSVAHSDEA